MVLAVRQCWCGSAGGITTKKKALSSTKKKGVDGHIKSDKRKTRYSFFLDALYTMKSY